MQLPNLLRFSLKGLPSLVFLIFIALLLTTFFLSAKLTSAQVPNPPVPCNQVRPNLLNPFDEEFHSLRPYQASPCSDERDPVAQFCGNDLVLTDTITVRRNDSLYCQRFSPTEEECFFRVTQNRQLAIDVSGAELPIMGRTEDDVVNSQIQPNPEGTNDPRKVNEYVSWYLNGVTGRAEYGFLDVEMPADFTKKSEGAETLINYSGVLKKLLPQRIQTALRINTINEAFDSRYGGAGIRHDQIIGCTYGIPTLLGTVGNFPGQCYGLLAAAANFIGLREERRLSEWRAEDEIPPPEDASAFPDYIDYIIAYKRWRGFSCAVYEIPSNVPIIGGKKFFLCLDSPLRVNFWSSLFPHIPFSSTEDRLGQIGVVNPYVQPVQPDVTISNVSILTSPADLFFSHMEESQELADILQDTYVPKDNPESGPVTGVSPAEYCDLTEIRTNPGDDLFAGEIGVNLTYTAEFSCAFEIFDPADPVDRFLCDNFFNGRCYTNDWDCDNWGPGSPICPSGYRCGYPSSSCNPDPPNPSCTRNARVVLNTITETPLVDDIWSRLVAGSSAVFKRIFPKVEPGAPVEGIIDIPAATGVTYRLDPPVPGVSLTAGSPGNQRGSAAELYFPHIGGIHQYFLECIQTALRPQGFGEACPSGEPPTTTSTCPSVPDSAIPSGWLGAPKQNFINIATQRIAGCTSPDDNLAEECYNYVVRQSLTEGVNPAFSLTMWFNESAASNYCIQGDVYDFGIKNGAPAENIVEQLDLFLVQPFRISAACRNDPAWTEPMEAFLSVFHGNYKCDTLYDDGGYYLNTLNNSWIPVTDGWGGCGGGSSFGISWPTDSSCP